jgi:hypothetical protein
VPLTGWSREHGDLRVPHFIGLHGLQALALAAVALRRWRRPEAARARAILAITASYASLFALLIWQALRGESFVAPDAMTLALIAIAGWLPLVFLPRVRWATSVVPVVVPFVLALVYAALVAWALPWSEGGFSSLSGVQSLFENPWALLAGWTHYLAFDLLIGGWEVRDARERGIPHLLMVPVLALTFLLGPCGLLLYLLIRSFVPNKHQPGVSWTDQRVDAA